MQPSTRDMACSVTNFDIFDATNHPQDLEDDAADGVYRGNAAAGAQGRTQASNESSSMQQRVDDIVMMSLVSRGCLLNVDEGRVSSSDSPPKLPVGPSVEEDALAAIASQKIYQVRRGNDGHRCEVWIYADDLLCVASYQVMSSSRLLRSMKLVDLAMQQNRHHLKHANYRASPLIAHIDKVLKEELPESHMASKTFAPGLSNSMQSSGARFSRQLALDDSAGLPAKTPPIRLNPAAVPSKPKAEVSTGPGGGINEFNATSPEITKLWSHSCQETSGREVTALAWSTSQLEGRESTLKVMSLFGL